MRQPEVNWIPGLPELAYQDGVGCYDAVVMHFTANYNSTPDSERTWMSNHFEDAFVHEFIGPYKTVQVANPKYLAYGAGPKMNHRAIHLELCVAKSHAEFSTSYSEWCQRAAWFLAQRKLGVSNPKKKGDNGTLWGHFQVAAFLGGTTHEDPVQYLKGWGKSWADVVTDVSTYYNVLTAPKKEEIKMSDVFKDIPAGHWCEANVKLLKTAGILKGLPDGTFGGDKPVTRYELAAAMAEMYRKGVK